MASIIRKGNGRRMIQFIDTAGKRRTVRLGKMSQRQAEAVKTKVENLVAAAISGHAIDDETARWVANLDSVLADKLSRVGLIPRRQTTSLKACLDAYIKSRTDLKPRTIMKLRTTQEGLLDFFGGPQAVDTRQSFCGPQIDSEAESRPVLFRDP